MRCCCGALPGSASSSSPSRLARALLCLSPRDGDACGECRACHLSRVGNHPDELRLAPPEDKHTIGIDQVRDLIDQLELTARGGAYKVAIGGAGGGHDAARHQHAAQDSGGAAWEIGVHARLPSQRSAAGDDPKPLPGLFVSAPAERRRLRSGWRSGSPPVRIWSTSSSSRSGRRSPRCVWRRTVRRSGAMG